MIQRFLKEKPRDRLLTRKRGNAGILRDPLIRGTLHASQSAPVPFIVVATPVEEVGRDHDFDWAVIEPSSTRSIVQTAGRVNRHRRLAVSLPSVALLQLNYRCAMCQKTVFLRPGFESADAPYPSHDLAALLDWDRLAHLDARLMFEEHALARIDEQSIESTLAVPLRRFFALDETKPWWMGQAIYDEYPLREENWQLRIHWDGEDRFSFLVPAGEDETWLDRSSLIKRRPRVTNDWLVWRPDELIDACESTGTAPAMGLRVAIEGQDPQTLLGSRYLFDESFGFLRAPD